MATEDSNTDSHAQKLLLSLQEQRRQLFTCDFVIKVNDRTFPVHRNVLAAFSGYFRGIFLHNTAEAKQGFIDLSNLDAGAVEKCIDYMYTGKADVTRGKTQHLLYVCGVMQLDELAKLCFETLEPKSVKSSADGMLKSTEVRDKPCTERLEQKTENPEDMPKKTKVSNCKQLKDIARECVKDNFKTLIKAGGFPLLTFNDFKSCIASSEVGTATTWQAIVKWMNDDDLKIRSHLTCLIKFASDKQNFPFLFVLNTVLEEAIVKRREDFQRTAVARLLSDLDTFRNNVSLATVTQLTNALRGHDYRKANEARSILYDFAVAKFDKILQKSVYLRDLTKTKLMALFEHFPPGEQSEKNKWLAIMSWIEGNSCSRAVFSEFLKIINFNILTSDFIKQTTKWELHISNQEGDADTVLNVIGEYMEKKVDATPQVAATTSTAQRFPSVVVAENKTGVIKSWNVKKSKWSCIGVAQHNKELFVVSVRDDLYLLNNNSLLQLQADMAWKEKSPLPRQTDIWTKVVSSGNRIFVIGRDKLSCYITTEDTWNDFETSTCLELGFGAAASLKFIYVAGGVSKGRMAKRYIFASQSWEELAAMKTERYDPSAALLNGHLYVLCGWWGNKALASVEQYHFASAEWTKVTSLNVPRHAFSACVILDQMFVVGGDFSPDEKQNNGSIEVYDDSERTWKLVQLLESNESPCRACAYKAYYG